MAFKKRRSLYGSSRASYFKEAKPSRRKGLFKKRAQRVKLRGKAVAQFVRRTSHQLFSFVKWGTIVGLLAWGIVAGIKFWASSPFFTIKQVIFEKDIPDTYVKLFPVKAGDHLFQFNSSELEDLALQKFPQLKSLSIHRMLDGSVRVEGSYRQPLALMEQQNGTFAFDRTGTVFKINWQNKPQTKLPMVVHEGKGKPFEQWALALEKLETEAPEFYSLINHIKTDRIKPLQIILDNGVVVLWGDLNERFAVERAKNLLVLFKRFEPRRPGATVRFVSTDRVVIDSNWKDKNS